MAVAGSELQSLKGEVASWQTERFAIRQVHCGSCAGKVERALRAAPEIGAVEVGGDRCSLTVSHRFADPVRSINQLLAGVGDYRVEQRRRVRLALAAVARYRPLIAMGLLVALFVLARQALGGWPGHGIMADMMAGYFLLFGALKAMNLRAFAPAYARYDWLARQSASYARAYPFIELGLGIAYLAAPASAVLNLATLLLMGEKAWSVHRALRRGQITQCACLGGFFSIPISTVTVVEDLAMAAMAAAMLAGAH